MDRFLIFMGIIFVCILIVGVAMAIYYGLAELIDNWKRDYRIKHRFDKPPTAKCYCKDCKYHSNETNRCYRFELKSGYHCTADNWFCWEAEPRKEITE